jgi:hypothetical protein
LKWGTFLLCSTRSRPRAHDKVLKDDVVQSDGVVLSIEACDEVVHSYNVMQDE